MQLNNSDPILSGITGLFYTTNISFCCSQLRYFQNSEIESHPPPHPTAENPCASQYCTVDAVDLYSSSCICKVYSKTNLQKKLFETWSYCSWVEFSSPKIYTNCHSKVRIFNLKEVMMCITKLYIYAYTLCPRKKRTLIAAYSPVF